MYPDVVEISVQSPGAVDLTLIDLPGLVRSVGKGESESLVSDIASLAIFCKMKGASSSQWFLPMLISTTAR